MLKTMEMSGRCDVFTYLTQVSSKSSTERHVLNEKLTETNASKKLMMMGLKGDKPSGLVDLHSRHLQLVAMEIPDALGVIFQISLDSEKVPTDWEVENIIPEFKNGSKGKLGNDSSVGLTSEVGKSRIYY